MSSATPPSPSGPPPGPPGPRNNWVRVGSAAAARLTVESQDVPGAVVVRAVGEAELPPETDLLQQSLTRLCAARPTLLVIDLSALRFASSLALGAMTAARRSLAGHGGRVVLVGPTRPVRDVLNRTGLAALFPVLPTVDTALGRGSEPVPRAPR